jgi:hypothetical protein
VAPYGDREFLAGDQFPTRLSGAVLCGSDNLALSCVTQTTANRIRRSRCQHNWQVIKTKLSFLNSIPILCPACACLGRTVQQKEIEWRGETYGFHTSGLRLSGHRIFLLWRPKVVWPPDFLFSQQWLGDYCLLRSYTV